MRQQGVPPVVAVVLWKLVGRSRTSTPQLSGGRYPSSELAALRGTNFSDEGIKAWIEYCRNEPALKNKFPAPLTVGPDMSQLMIRVKRVIKSFYQKYPNTVSRIAAGTAAENRRSGSQINVKPEFRQQHKREREKKVDGFASAAADQEKLEQCINRYTAARDEISEKIRNEREEIKKLLLESFRKTVQEIRNSNKTVSKFLEQKTVKDLKTSENTEEVLRGVKRNILAKVQTIKELNRSKWTVPVERDPLDNTKSFNAVIHLLVHSPKIVEHVLTSQLTDGQHLLNVLKHIILRMKCFPTNELKSYVDNLAKEWARDTPEKLLTSVAAAIAPNRTTSKLLKVRYLTLETENIKDLIREEPDIIFAVGRKDWATDLGEKYLLRGGITNTPRRYTTTVFSDTEKTTFSGTSAPELMKNPRPSDSTTYDLALYERV
jgi:hypothetical protein